MEITSISSYLVAPGKGRKDPPDVRGVMMALEGPEYDLLSEVFERSDKECDIPIRFLPENGNRQNQVLGLIRDYLDNPSVQVGLPLAERLRGFTTGVSRLGLLFLIAGLDDDAPEHKFVISRFPAERGLLAEETEDALEIAFLERVFMKNVRSYKAALYKGEFIEEHFWKGWAVDRQLDHPAAYWIREFLASDFRSTPKEGTKRFAKALQNASKEADSLDIQREIVGLRMLAGNLAGRSISISQVLDDYGISERSRDLIIAQLAHDGLADDVFALEPETFRKHAEYTSVELDSGGVLMAPTDDFEYVFEREEIGENEVRYQTTGREVFEILRGKP